MNAREAALLVLEQAGEPLHTKELTRRILAQKLWHPSGKTPEATVEATISSHVKRHGDRSPFVRTGPSTYALRESAQQPREGRQKPPALSESEGTTYSFSKAAFQVLGKFANKQPMHYREITEKALEMGWLRTSGKTPEASMYTQIYSEIERQKKRGELPRFAKHGRGYFGLSRWTKLDLASQIEHHNKKVREALRGSLFTMQPDEFERLVARLLGALGFDGIEVTRRSSDGGIDVRGMLVVGETIRTRMAVQVKRWARGHNVQAQVVREVRGSLGVHEQGLIITTSDFSSGAKDEAARPDAVPVGLMDGEQLVALLIENDICITRTSHDIIRLGEEGPDA